MILDLFIFVTLIFLFNPLTNVFYEEAQDDDRSETFMPIRTELQKCQNFEDKRSSKSSGLTISIPGNLTNSDKSVNFRISYEPIKLQCKSGRKTLRTVKWEDGKRLMIVKSKMALERLRTSGKTSNHFTHEGYVHIQGNYYRPKQDYCIKSVSDFQIKVETCDITCSNSDKICIPKCCGPDEILEYWTFRCKTIGEGGEKWNPKLHDLKYPDKVIGDLNSMEQVHIMRQPVQCPERLWLDKWPLTDTVGARIRNKEDPGIAWKLVPNARPIFMDLNRKWVHVPEGSYCMDGFANWGYGGTGKYSGNPDLHSVLLICPTSNATSMSPVVFEENTNTDTMINRQENEEVKTFHNQSQVISISKLLICWNLLILILMQRAK